MKTAFYALLENESRPHIIFAHIHRRQNEIDFVLANAGSTSLKTLDDEQVLDLVICSTFAARVSGRVGCGDDSVFGAAISRKDTREYRGNYETFARVLAYHVIAPAHMSEYTDIVRDSDDALWAIDRPPAKAA